MGDRRIRVLHVFGRLLRGGAELRTIELAESFGGERVQSDFLVLSGQDGTLDERVRASGGEVIKCPLHARFPASFFRLLRRNRYDVVHSHVHYFSGVILALARAAGVPGRVAHFRTAIVNDRGRSFPRDVQLAICRRLIDLNATDILAVGEGAMAGAWRETWRSDARCRVIYNGIPPHRLQAQAADGPSATPTVVNVASIQPLKNQLRLVGIMRRAVREVPDLRAVLVGRESSDYGMKVRQAAGEAGLGDRIHLVGEVDDPIQWMACANLMILPSLWEGLPGAALEACALGVPVLAADLPGTRELRRYFPTLTVMGLDERDESWAAAAIRLIRQGTPPRREAAARFATSPFTLARAREAHYEVWRRACAAR